MRCVNSIEFLDLACVKGVGAWPPDLLSISALFFLTKNAPEIILEDIKY